MDAFKRYLTTTRNYRPARANPRHADLLPAEVELTRHLDTVTRWIGSDGASDRGAMKEAMNYFGSRYRATGNIYRGVVGGLYFDGAPASYTTKQKIAEGFAMAMANAKGKKDVFVIKRKAAATSLDFKKLLKAYSSCSIARCDEAEVVAFNTPVPDRNITEYTFD